ncbi:MAG: tetratricopeptide repeat protein, partial [Terriglobia bacterium]
RTNAGLAWALFLGRHYDQAIAQSRNTLEMDRNFPMAHWVLGMAYEQKGRLEEAIAELQQAAASDSTPLVQATLAHTYAVAGKEGQARKLLAALSSPPQPMYVSPTDRAMIHVGLDEKEQAIALLEQAYQVRDSRLALIKILPQFDPLRDEPRFQALLRRMKFPP